MRRPDAVAILLLALAAGPAAAQPVLRVPGDVPTLQQAINRVRDGGVIELAVGTYPSPAGGFRIADERKSFTVRSTPDFPRAVLDGAGANPVLVFENRNLGSGGPVRFERLIFRGGLADDEAVAGGVTVRTAEATFVDCLFEDNTTLSAVVGGALSVGEESFVTVESTTFEGNTTLFAGGGIAVVDSVLGVSGSRFTDNRTNIPGHVENAVGGALFVLSSVATVTDSIFQDNEAALVGGAIFVFGIYDDLAPATTADFDARLRVVRSTFRDNRAAPDPCCGAPVPSGGGAIHAEDAALVEIVGSYFDGNRGRFGGAVQSFRAALDIEGSIFQDNRASEPGAPLGIGGAIAALSSAGVSDPSTPNRAPASVEVRDSLVRGLLSGAPSAAQGGCLEASGDRAELEAGRGGLAENRVPIGFEKTAFADCHAAAAAGVPTFGGAISVDTADLAADRLLVLGSEARGTLGLGGGLSARLESAVALEDSTFAGNVAERFGGGVFADDAPRIDVSDGRFFANRVGGGAADGARRSRGAALFVESAAAAPGPGRTPDARGVVEDTLFAANVGLEVRDSAPGAGENRVRYDDNRFFTTVFGGLVYAHDPARPDGLDVAGLNALVLPGGIDKSADPNTRLFSRPVDGDLLVFPPAGAAADPSPAFAAFAWSGSRATLVGPGGDQALAERHGVVEIPDEAGEYTLRVDGQSVASETFDPPPPPLPPGPFLAVPDLPDFRFKVQILAGGNTLPGTQEPGCIAETVCVSGALPGRSEVFLRVVGPKPNGFLQPTLVKFSTSRVRIWIEQVSTGELRFYELDNVPVGAGRLALLDGLIDRTGFRPAGAPAAAGAAALPSTLERITGSAALRVLRPRATTGPPPPIPPGGRMSSPAFPGFFFTVRITAGGSSRLGAKEDVCIEETLCVSGALPGRSEVFLRVVGPKPNGFLQPTIVTFSTSTLEIWIERPATGDVQYYRLDGVSGPPSGAVTDLGGVIDREGFLP